MVVGKPIVDGCCGHCWFGTRLGGVLVVTVLVARGSACSLSCLLVAMVALKMKKIIMPAQSTLFYLIDKVLVGIRGRAYYRCTALVNARAKEIF